MAQGFNCIVVWEIANLDTQEVARKVKSFMEFVEMVVIALGSLVVSNCNQDFIKNFDLVYE